MATRVTVFEAKGVANAAGTPCKLCYVTLEVDSIKRKTKAVKEDANPTWRECWNLIFNTTRPMVFSVLDNGDLVGRVQIDASKVMGQSDAWYPITPDGGAAQRGQLHIKVELGVSGAQVKIPANVVSEMKDRLQQCQRSHGSSLDMSACSLPVLPKVVTQLSFITKLDLGFNLFSAWPAETAAFPSLEELQLRGNQLNEVPAAVGALVTLKYLGLNGNALMTISPAIGKLTQLERLELSNNQIRELPKEIGRLAGLQQLHLSGNPLTTVPASVGALRSLETLDLSCCNLVALPEEFTLMGKMLELNLGSNMLTILPEGMGRMLRLAQLNVMDNQLRDLPLSLGYCSGLGEVGSGIGLSRNPIDDTEMLRRYQIGPDYLLDYLQKRLAQENYPKLPQLDLPEDLGEGPLPPWVVEKQQRQEEQQQQQQHVATAAEQQATMQKVSATLLLFEFGCNFKVVKSFRIPIFHRFRHLHTDYAAAELGTGSTSR
eukprot:TRINITY_DN3083_c0_g1_i6.p1 TRINITY_DN3083_c0_g1~~TRINITY_DN3083_c0_g1_i6.p1  ORF type:complete len:497 (-),score=125.74 TRINITY_DN3083_c0_g1_i6:667-2130(-)